jgi:hypothetical protein
LRRGWPPSSALRMRSIAFEGAATGAGAVVLTQGL